VHADEAAAEVRVAMDAALERAGRLEQENDRLRQANAALAKSLAAANTDAKASRDELQSLRADLEALGLTVFDPGDRESRRRLITAMAEAGRERDARAKLEQQLLQICESVVLFLDRQGDVDPKLRAQLEAELRSADQALAAARATAEPVVAPSTGLTDARVLSIKPDLGLAVLNVGARSGVRLGMPFNLVRQDRVIGAAIVVDVRDDVSGLVALDGGLAIEQLQVGDAARPGVN
jgi:hypothetical protein